MFLSVMFFSLLISELGSSCGLFLLFFLITLLGSSFMLVFFYSKYSFDTGILVFSPWKHLDQLYLCYCFFYSYICIYFNLVLTEGSQMSNRVALLQCYDKAVRLDG